MSKPYNKKILLMKLMVFSLIAFGFIGCSSNPYQTEISKLHSRMSKNEMVDALGVPYGITANGATFFIYYKNGTNSMLAVLFNNQGTCGWLLLEVSSTGPSETFSFYKVKKHSDDALQPSRTLHNRLSGYPVWSTCVLNI